MGNSYQRIDAQPSYIVIDHYQHQYKLYRNGNVWSTKHFIDSNVYYEGDIKYNYEDSEWYAHGLGVKKSEFGQLIYAGEFTNGKFTIGKMSHTVKKSLYRLGTFTNDRLDGPDCVQKLNMLTVRGTFRNGDAVDCNVYGPNGDCVSTGHSTVDGKLDGAITHYGKMTVAGRTLVSKKQLPMYMA